MVRSALADNSSLNYIKDVAKENSFSVGLILGQSYSGKYHIVHFAKTPPFQTEENKLEVKPVETLTNISNINETWLAEHARHTTRMLPGGMCVLGIFVISEDDVFTPFAAKLKSILLVLHKQLSLNKYLYGSNENEKLVLHLSSKTDRCSVKTFDVVTSNVQPAEVKFLPKSTKWNILECKYEIDQVHYLTTDETEGPLKKHIKVILDKIHNSLSSGIFLFDSELKEKDDSIESIKKHKVPRGNYNKGLATHDENNPIQISIYEQCNKENLPFEAFETGGQIRIVGEVVSKLYLNPKVVIEDASQALVQDIMRSLSTRLEMHWDSLTEEELSEDLNSVHEPPRRVLISLPDNHITFSDYLFPGEGPEDAKLSLEEMLDVRVHENLTIQDVEGQVDISQYYNGSVESESEETLPKLPSDTNMFMYGIGLAVALLVLLISLLVHLYM